MAVYDEIFNHTLPDLLTDIHQGKARLPDFQRSFVWEPDAIAELISSMMQSFPAGSILRVKNSADTFSHRAVEGAPDLSIKPVFLILDGQQRLTSLYQAFYGVGSHAFYIDLKALESGAEVDTDIIIAERRKSRRAKQLAELKYQAENRLLPLETLFGTVGGVAGWVQQVSDVLSNTKEEMLDIQRELNQDIERWIEPIKKYIFPVITLSDSTGPAAICTIFETLNRRGIKLSPFELLTARFFHGGNNLRELWAAAKTGNPEFERYDVDPYAVLQATTLRVHDAQPTCKRSALMELKNEDIDKHWESVVAALGEALAILRDDCGVLGARWLPYSSMLVPFAAVLAKQPLGHSPEAGANRAKLIRWFWCSALSQRYDSSANRKSEEDYMTLSAWMSGKDAPDYVKNFSFELGLLDSTSPKQRARYAALMSLQQRRDPKLGKQSSLDFHTGKSITPELIDLFGIDDHHVFPLDHLGEDRKNDRSPANGILNRTLIDAKTNKKIGGRAPKEYLGDVKKALEPAGVEVSTVLNSHMIDATAGAALWKDDFEAFLAERRVAFETAIRSATQGQVISATGEEDEAA